MFTKLCLFILTVIKNLYSPAFLPPLSNSDGQSTVEPDILPIYMVKVWEELVPFAPVVSPRLSKSILVFCSFCGAKVDFLQMKHLKRNKKYSVRQTHTSFGRPKRGGMCCSPRVFLYFFLYKSVVRSNTTTIKMSPKWHQSHLLIYAFINLINK